ncbi:MAG: thiol-disulfide oxidoreductase DCC family protein [Planctomyces sp.]
MTDLSNSSLIFYDGVCGFCNHSVNWILQRDKSGRVLLAPLQGSTPRQLLAPEVRQTLSSGVLRHNGHLYTHSAAVCRILFLLGGFWWVCGALLWIIPSPLRDFGYRCVAKVRYRLFGKRDACRLPAPHDRARFLD